MLLHICSTGTVGVRREAVYTLCIVSMMHTFTCRLICKHNKTHADVTTGAERLTSSSLVLAAAHGRVFTANVPAIEAPTIRAISALVVPCCSSHWVACSAVAAPTLPRHLERMCMLCCLTNPVGQKAKACARDAKHRRKGA